MPRPTYSKIKTSSQKINDLNIKLMTNEIASKLDGIQYNTLNEHVHLNNDMLKSILDKYVSNKIQMQNWLTKLSLV